MLEVIPDNPETLCMKGLLLNLTDKQEEGLDLAKKVRLIITNLCFGFDEEPEERNLLACFGDHSQKQQELF